MVHVNGNGGGVGVNRGMNGYYDAGYAAEVWQDLIPGRNGGGLISRCQDLDLDLNNVPRGCLDGGNVLDVLSQGQGQGQGQGGSMVVWNDDVVRLLGDLIADGAGSGSRSGGGAVTATTAGNEGMEMLVDDLAERFLASVFQEGGFQGVGVGPIVENVL